MSEIVGRFSPERLQSTPLAAIVVMGAVMTEHESTGAFYYPLFHEYREGKDVDGEIRARAAALAYLKGLTDLVIVTGGPERSKKLGTTVSRAVRLGLHMASFYNVPRQGMIFLPTPPSTTQNIAVAGDHLSVTAARFTGERIGFLSNDYHMIRVREFFERDEGFDKLKVYPQFIPAETFLLEHGELNWSDVAELYQTPRVVRQLENEWQGVLALHNDTYKFNGGIT